MTVRTSLISTVLLCLAFVSGDATCPGQALVPLSFVLEYALWRGWQQAVIYTPDIEPGCRWATVRLIKCLSANGVAAALNSMSGARVRSRLGVVILSSRLRYNATGSLSSLLEELNKLQMGTASYDWLIATRYFQDLRHINKILNATSIRFDQNLVVSYTNNYKHYTKNSTLGLCENNFVYKTISQSPQSIGVNTRRVHRIGENIVLKKIQYDNRDSSAYESGYYRTSQRYKNLSRNHTYNRLGKVWPLVNSGVINYNYSRAFEMVNTTRFSLKQQFGPQTQRDNEDERPKTVQIYLAQYFKVKINSTLYARNLGIWSQNESMSNVDVPYPVEARTFLGEEMIVGRCNSSGDGAPTLDDDGPSAPASLDDVLNFLTVRLKANSSTRYYSKLGLRTYEGTWTGLLGALMDHTVDIALEPVTALTARHQDMDFIFPIAETMCNIYIRQQETSTVRDIFLAPFSARLVACVVAVALVAALAVVLISKLSPTKHIEERRMGYTEAVIWAIGILCQQGGSWTPPNSASSVLLIVCLLFAVVTYNAYAAFITSVLSVRVASVDTVAAVLRSPNFKIGYIRNGADQNYLMSTKDAQLNAFYIRGYSDAENLVPTAEEGLSRAASQDYAFFAGQRAARSTLRSLSQARGRCAVREVPVHSTRAQLAFPLPRHSPYARPTLVSLLQLRSGGCMARLEAALVPDMPHCAPPPGFASARAADVRSALLLLVVGYIAALFLGVGEYCWKNRYELHVFFTKCYSRLLNIVK